MVDREMAIEIFGAEGGRTERDKYTESMHITGLTSYNCFYKLALQSLHIMVQVSPGTTTKDSDGSTVIHYVQLP